MKISVIFIGELHDSGFNQRAFEGVERMQRHSGDVDIEVVSGISYDPDAMETALRKAAERSEGVVFIGGQGNLVTPSAAVVFPDRAFAVVQGNVAGTNLASYDVLQEQSAFLAGVLAARMTRTGTVGHLSGHRVAPGLKGRAAFAAGVRHADKNVRLVTGFCGTQDDSAVTEAWASALAGDGADILFTMLNAARDGATRACRATGMRQIGNATDWIAIDPEVFVASAVARIDLGVARAIEDMRSGVRPGEILELGLREDAMCLSITQDVPDAIRQEVADLIPKIADGVIPVDVDYDGPEFEAAS
jgi:basic membrane protein A